MSRGWRLLLLLPLLGGCAALQPAADTAEQLDSWVATQQYGKALAALDRLPANAPLRARRSDIAAKARAFEQQTVAQANQYLQDDHWAEAQQTYARALEKWPDSAVFKTGAATLEQERLAQLAELKLELLVARAERLERLLPIYAAIAAADPGSWWAQRDLNGVRDEAAEVTRQLIDAGRKALDDKQMATARRLLIPASRLAAEASAKQAAQQQLRRLATLEPEQKQKAEGGAKEVMQRYQEAYAAHDWLEARRLMTLMQQQPNAPAELKQMRATLEKAIAAAVNHMVDRGVSLYSRAKYEEALALWLEARQLAPGDERLKANITRAEQVIKKLHSLQKKQGGE